MSIEAVCFKNEHRYFGTAAGGFVCHYCREYITSEEFDRRVATKELVYCELCHAWHAPHGRPVEQKS